MIIFTEKKFASEIIAKLSKKSYNLYEMTILCKWLRYNIFSSKTEEEADKLIRNTLICFCKLCWEDFDEDVEYIRINKAIERSKVELLRTCYPIRISKKEWQIISSLKSETGKKILFVMLVVAKFNRANPIKMVNEKPIEYADNQLRCNTDIGELYKLAKIRYKKNGGDFSYLSEYRGLVELKDGKTLKRVLKFADLEVSEEDTFMEIADYDNIIQYYNMQFDPTIKICKHCKNIFKDNSKSQSLKTCPTCRKEEKIVRVLICEDCGKRVVLENKRGVMTRCSACQKEYRKKYKNEKAKEKKRKNLQKTR